VAPDQKPSVTTDHCPRFFEKMRQLISPWAEMLEEAGFANACRYSEMGSLMNNRYMQSISKDVAASFAQSPIGMHGAVIGGE